MTVTVTLIFGKSPINQIETGEGFTGQYRRNWIFAAELAERTSAIAQWQDAQVYVVDVPAETILVRRDHDGAPLTDEDDAFWFAQMPDGTLRSAAEFRSDPTLRPAL